MSKAPIEEEGLPLSPDASTEEMVPVKRRPPKRRSVTAFFGLATLGSGAVLFLGAVLVAAAIGVGVAWVSTTFFEPRPVTIVVTGVAADVDVGVQLGGEVPAYVHGDRHVFPKMEQGPVTVHWVTGEACAGPRCPGVACKAWCVTGEVEAQVEAGTGEAVIEIAVDRGSPASIRVEAQGMPEDSWGAVEIAGQRVVLSGGVAEVDGLLPAPYTLVGAAGSCGDSLECATTGDCPRGCATVSIPVVVPADGTRLVIPLVFETP